MLTALAFCCSAAVVFYWFVVYWSLFNFVHWSLFNNNNISNGNNDDDDNENNSNTKRTRRTTNGKVGISSTLLREHIAAGISIAGLVPPGIVDCIANNFVKYCGLLSVLLLVFIACCCC